MTESPITEPVLRRMGLQDLDWVAAEHRRHFPDGFFARLGPRFLRRYYRTFLDGPTAVALVVEHDDRPQGYLVGVLSPRLHRRLLMDFHGRSLAASGLLGLLRRPRLVWVFVSTRAGQYLRALLPGVEAGRPTGRGPGAPGRPLPC